MPQEWSGKRKQAPLPPKPEQRTPTPSKEPMIREMPEAREKIPSPPKVVIPKMRKEDE